MSAPSLKFVDLHPRVASLRDEILDGFESRPKSIPPKFFYDEQGSTLFKRITELPEYYPTRTEIGILRDCAAQLTDLIGTGGVLIELGSGDGHKVRILLDALRPSIYVPIDISKEYLLSASRALATDYPWLKVYATCADYSEPLVLPYCPPDLRRVVFFPGSSLGNFEPVEAQTFLAQLTELLQKDGVLLIGIDLKKDPKVLDSAYNDAQGVTAAFNLNVLTRIKRELGAEIDLEAFRHDAFYNPEEGRVEMHLINRVEQTVNLGDKAYTLEEGERIHTENSYKYTVEEFQALARRAGYRPVQVWTDEQALFSVHLLEVSPPAVRAVQAPAPHWA